MSAGERQGRHKQMVRMSLPTKISGIVFWGMVLVGFLAGAYILDQREAQLISEYNGHILHTEQEIEKVYNSYSDDIFDQDFMSRQIEKLFLQLQEQYPIEALSYEFAGNKYLFGTIGGQQEHIKTQLLIRVLSHGVTEVIALDVFMKGLDKTIVESRKRTLIIIVGLVFVFGMILQQILQIVLSHPILEMVISAQAFARGDQSARFNESRNDEFGYLSKFINEALDSLLRQQHELVDSRKALVEEKLQAEVTLHSIMDGVITTSAENRILYLNPVAERMLGMTSAQTRELDLSQVVQITHEDTGKPIASPTLACLKNSQVETLESHAALVSHSGKVIPIEATSAPMRNDRGEIIGAVMVLQDVSHERKLRRQLSYQASHDMLTGLFNRRMFEELTEAVILNLTVENRQHALCYVDLDQFKIVNDTCGHVAGDELLRQLGELLKGCIREGDILARLGGDEFGLLLENCSMKQATQLAEKVRLCVKNLRFSWKDKSFEIGASIGVVGINSENMDLQSILASADMACYAAKDMGRNRVHVYEPSDAMLAERHGQMHWAGRITRALEEHRMVLYEQPVAELKENELAINHCEVLLRMKDEDGVIVLPDTFIPAAERYNLMPKIDRWVISQVFQNLSAASGSAVSDKIVAINLSGTSLADEDLLTFILDEAEKYQINLNNICFEVTETAAISNLNRAGLFIKELKARGCRFSLDDFGSGLSSFTYLKNLPVDYIKIDGSFVVDMLNDPVDKVMVEAIVRVGRVMQIKVIAEWVENEQTLMLLKEMGVDYVQGYHLGVPRELHLINHI